ncbi:lipopolysaccharide-induced tumor necrosis factor-alpha factor homolog [Parasteatoda tepidariorum]|nr:lipopolysaccharide-induced tumor necrosis factor-alpha factor homolog isoform X1 [Parasteatoda tepidariorum]
MEQTPQTTVVVMPVTPFGPDPMQITCGNCHKAVVTTTVATNGACAWIAAIMVCICCCPLFWVPLCIDSCKDVQHQCPSCGAYLGAYKKI